jgi:hypothetical protein
MKVPEFYRTQYERFTANPTRALALKFKCLECMNWQREEVKLCTSPSCPLFGFRPGVKRDFKKKGAKP